MYHTTLLTVITFCLCSVAFAQDSPVVPPTEAIAGVDQVDWSQSWWQWAGSFDDSDSPVADVTGEFCHLKQKGDVWFLAGTYGYHRTSRTCKVPRDKYLFFPLINYASHPLTGKSSLTCESVTTDVEELTNNVSELLLEVDGVRIPLSPVSHRQATKHCFDFAALHENGGGLFPAASNGYYVMLKPLKPGTHTLSFGGTLPDTAQDITYTLHVQ